MHLVEQSQHMNNTSVHTCMETHSGQIYRSFTSTSYVVWKPISVKNRNKHDGANNKTHVNSKL